MIKIMTVEDIVKILTLKDDKFAELFPCDVGEWVQFLIQNVNNPNFFIIGAIEDGKLMGYMVAISAIFPPVSQSVSAIYLKTAGIENNKKELDELIKWSKEKGAISIDFITDNPTGHAVYGFKKKATLMTMKL